ncbi:prion-inhibition and propagation, helo domain-containing protein [Xylaria venustula]|nr:prion-inhibition and propagation, helo domain-containing protein [Xylaria venustula]
MSLLFGSVVSIYLTISIAPMEPAGLAVGVAGLIGIFTACLDIVERWDSYKDFGVESGSLIARFQADKVRFRQWGQRVGIYTEKHGDGYHKALDDPLIRPAVDQILQSIKHFDDDTGDITSGLRLISSPVDPQAYRKSDLSRQRPHFENHLFFRLYNISTTTQL